ERSLLSARAIDNANGGNININSQFLIAPPNENSDINASAVRGNGGNIQIETFGIFGIDRRNTNTPNSDITASSEFGVDGLVNIVLREVSPDREKIVLPEETVDVSKLVGQNSCAIARENQFIVTKRSGLPDSPDRDLKIDSVWEDWSIVKGNRQQGIGNRQQGIGNRQQGIGNRQQGTGNREQGIGNREQQEKLVNAQSWFVSDRGSIILTAQPPTSSIPIPWLNASGCTEKN
ncbi:MAG: hypothetical protein ACRC11_09630, partial [Xenococcaceae cyanobacterium]